MLNTGCAKLIVVAFIGVCLVWAGFLIDSFMIASPDTLTSVVAGGFIMLVIGFVLGKIASNRKRML